ncbi:MAG: ABC transporter permease [Microbacteriaceae bacterium]
MIDQQPTTETVAIGTVDDPQAPWWKKILTAQAFQIFLILVLIVIAFAVVAPTQFAQWSNFRLILQNAAILAVLAVGMTFVIITAGIDLSIGSVLVFSGVVSAIVMRAMGGQGWGTAIVGILVAIVSGSAWGWINGVLVAKAKIPSLIVTLGTFGAALGFAQILTGGVDISSVPLVLTQSIGYGNVFGSLPVIVVIAAVFVVIGAIMLNFTKFGLYTRAVGSSEEASRRVGVKVDRHLIYVYTLTGGLAGVAGILSLSQFATTAIAGQSLTNLNVIAAVVIGGTSLFGGIGTIVGSIVGLFIPAVLQNGFVITGVQPYWQQVAVGAVLIAAVYADQLRRSAAARGGRGGAWKKIFGRRSG